MTAPRPTFRVLKNGYDRFAVDDAIERYAAQVDELQTKLATYEKQLAEANARLNELQVQYKELENSIAAEKQAADSIARLSLREANEIINTAQKNADEIVHQSLITARMILADLAKLYGDADAVKASSRAKLAGLVQELDDFRLPKMPDMRWLDEAEKRMH